ncbi:MAG: hypothetical protein PWP44_1758 [Thermacetogenium sp.]|uniref:Asp23/Gls24 family envelope stress response protein n=1 Tax=Thermacetogenium phaeum TaxID=85874 RepID=A0A101FGM9_9THEO|nr:MAG: Uncharacterized protein XD66_0597 [Thermacetogenium phaeum]MDN5366552.1 hypothetical protein [Thermacetogenium sp.]MDN5376611.1 hypothetical protein [Thermacetogenium sp.]
MGESQQTDYGKIEITQEALATIAGAAAVRCYGIVGMVPRGLRQGVSGILGKDDLNKGVEVRQEGSNVKIDLWVVMCYGVKMAEVARNVMETVRYEVEKMTGLRAIEVNVNVVGVRVIK